MRAALPKMATPPSWQSTVDCYQNDSLRYFGLLTVRPPKRFVCFVSKRTLRIVIEASSPIIYVINGNWMFGTFDWRGG